MEFPAELSLRRLDRSSLLVVEAFLRVAELYCWARLRFSLRWRRAFHVAASREDEFGLCW